uniref:Uncharacterized protein n=1 Tax=Anopheles dirus TaxID=7168 RepID=A0A182NXK0_9DIPT
MKNDLSDTLSLQSINSVGTMWVMGPPESASA